MALCRSFRVGLKTIVTGLGAAVGLNGGSCIQSSLERTAYPEPSVRRGMRQRGHNSGMTPVNRKAGTGERTREPSGKRLDLYSPVGFATTDLSVRFVMLVRGRSLWKRPLCGLSSSSMRLLGFLSVLRMLLPLAAAERQERSDWVSEEAKRISWLTTDALRPRWRNNRNSAEHGELIENQSAPAGEA